VDDESPAAHFWHGAIIVQCDLCSWLRPPAPAISQSATTYVFRREIARLPVCASTLRQHATLKLEVAEHVPLPPRPAAVEPSVVVVAVRRSIAKISLCRRQRRGFHSRASIAIRARYFRPASAGLVSSVSERRSFACAACDVRDPRAPSGRREHGEVAALPRRGSTPSSSYSRSFLQLRWRQEQHVASAARLPRSRRAPPNAARSSS